MLVNIQGLLIKRIGLTIDEYSAKKDFFNYSGQKNCEKVFPHNYSLLGVEKCSNVNIFWMKNI